MERITVQIESICPLLMCNDTIDLDITHPLNQQHKIDSKSEKAKTPAGLHEVQWLEFQMHAYWDDDIGLYCPSENVEACIRDGGRLIHKGASVVRALQVDPQGSGKIPFIHDKPGYSLADLWNDPGFVDIRPVRLNKKSKIPRCRLRLNNWKLKFEIAFSEEQLSYGVLHRCLTDAGLYVGLCDYRPRFGRFKVTSFPIPADKEAKEAEAAKAAKAAKAVL